MSLVATDEKHPLGTEAVWLLLKNGFDHGYRRLEWKCDSMNVASRRAAERLGFSWEGRLRQRLVRKGRTRDSDMLSIIDGEWPARDAALRAWLAAENFTADGQQIKHGGVSLTLQSEWAERITPALPIQRLFLDHLNNLIPVNGMFISRDILIGD